MKSTARRRNSLSYKLSLLLILAVVVDVNGLQNVSIDIPEAVAIGTTVTLTCRYDLQEEELYMLKWYKGKAEFYRFVPKEMPPIMVFGEFANYIDRVQSDRHRVTLKNVTQNLEGKYECEVSVDLPNFSSLKKNGFMHVVNLPQGIPEVIVEKQRYAIGETVKANCTTPPSNPTANVNWTVNGQLHNSSHIKIIQMDNDNRTRKHAELEFDITQDSFRNGRLKITCHANVFQLYVKDAVVFLDEERPRLASVLGTRDSPHTGGASMHAAKWLCVIVATNLLFSGFR